MYRVAKRILDFLFSLFLLILLIPLMLFISIFIKIVDKEAIIFKQSRAGMNNEVFEIYKFRTMNKDASGSNKITSLGRILRLTSLDEIPQLLNVLKGEMSICGPRPRLYEEDICDEIRVRLRVRPGITGLAQVRGRSSLSVDERLKLDIYYSQNLCFRMDFYILIKTVLIVILRKGSN